MSLTGVAALIAAASFAVLACAGVFLAVRFTRILGDAATLVRETRADQQALFARANAAVDRANAQLDRTEAVSASMDELGSSMEELAGQVSALAGFGRTMAGAVVSGPVGRAAAVAYGVRHAVALRRGGRRKLIVRGAQEAAQPPHAGAQGAQGVWGAAQAPHVGGPRAGLAPRGLAEPGARR
jgi:uncharacterized protein YoxC